MSPKKIHSHGILNDLRDYWWNPDFIALMAKRWELNKVKSMLDVGCGVGHWGQLLASSLPNDAMIVGIDPEITWIEKAEKRAQEKGLDSRSHYLLGSAENIPFPDNHFDMVTCQTVLIHVPDIDLATQEMLRVLKPGGLLAVSEPNNVASCLVFNNLDIDDSIDDIVNVVRYSLTLQRGKAALHEGYNSIGDAIPHYFSRAGLVNINVYLSDMADFYVPPYETPREQAILANTREISQASWDAEKAQSIKYFLAGGGTEDEFEQLWHGIIRRTETKVNGLLQRNIARSGGEFLYLISGRKDK